jgi:outer membrane protein OmpA-like peptidoglycan-associated protein
MTSDFRRHWQVALATLLIWCSAGLLGPIVRAADENPGKASEAESRAISDRLDALVEQATARVGKSGAQSGQPGVEVLSLRQQLEAAQTQIALLKNVVIQALRAQSAAEEALRREQETPATTAAPSGVPDPSSAQDPAVAKELAALTASVQGLRAEVNALRDQAPHEQVAEEHAASAPRETPSAGAAAALAAPAAAEDAMLPDSGMGGRYEPLPEDESVASGPSDAAAETRAEAIKVGEVHFNSGSAQLTPGGERMAREAIERIRSMEAAKVRVVAFADRVGGSAYNLALSRERALSIAAMLERGGLSRDMVEVVGNGENGVPEPTADGVAEPLNRCGGIFVVADNSSG